jgi:1-deoxy-D-xylulose-5-phosphate synthase
MHKAIYSEKFATAVRYPRGAELGLPSDFVSENRNFDIYPKEGENEKLPLIITYGRVFSQAVKAREKLLNQGLDTKILKLNKIKPIDPAALEYALGKEEIFFFEEGVKSGGVGEKFANLLLENAFKGQYKLFAVDDVFVKQATVEEQLKEYKLDADGIYRALLGGTDEADEEEA